MDLKEQLFKAFIIGIVCLLGFGTMALVVSRDQIVSFDLAVISYVQRLEAPILTAIMKFFTTIGSFKWILVIAIVVIIFLYFVLKHRSELFLFTIVIAATPIINGIIKGFFERARPDLHRLIEIGGYSFPSGHAMNAMAVYGILTFLFWRHIPSRLGRSVLIFISSVFILMIGISRIYLGVHYPSDIIGGYLASGFWLAVSILVYQKYREKR
nr:phosphatase PAP2 family protein [Lysinibacillus timonensis]